MKIENIIDLTIVVPTYNERENIDKLITGIESEMSKMTNPIEYEILVMDDNSPDKTSEVVEQLHKEGHKCRVIVRKMNRGLSPSVIEGFERAQGSVVLVMDADLQHPIEVVPKLYQQVADGADVAVGSRHCPGGGIENWAFHRRVISWGAALLARPFTSVSDPMSGFFAVRKELLKGCKLEAKGYKILLEVLVKTKAQKVVEVPITFTTRVYGESKLTSGVMFNYLLHLFALFMYPGTCPLLKFLVVGGLGMVVDVFVFTLLHTIIGVPLLGAQIFSYVCSLLNNFFWNSLWTFPTESTKQEKMKQFVKFACVSLVAFSIRTALVYFGQQFIPTTFPYPQMLLIGAIVTVTLINFVGSKLIVFK